MQERNFPTATPAEKIVITAAAAPINSNTIIASPPFYAISLRISMYSEGINPSERGLIPPTIFLMEICLHGSTHKKILSQFYTPLNTFFEHTFDICSISNSNALEPFYYNFYYIFSFKKSKSSLNLLPSVTSFLK